MKVKYIGDYYKVRLKKGTVYDVMTIENGWYKLTDELDEVGFYPPDELIKVD